MKRTALAALAVLLLAAPARADLFIPICPSGWTAQLLASLPFVRISCPVEMMDARAAGHHRIGDALVDDSGTPHRTSDAVAPPDNPSRRREARMDGGPPSFREAYRHRYDNGLAPALPDAYPRRYENAVAPPPRG